MVPEGGKLTGTVLLTGASGFLGKRIRKRLVEAGIECVAPSRDTLDVTRAFADFGHVDTVIHLAARTFVPDSWSQPALFWQVNAGGTINALEYCRRRRASMILVSAYCYGNPDSLPIAEHAPLRPSNPYAFSKVAAEDACRYYAADLGVPSTILRPFNIYGPGQDKRFLVPTVVR